jgi:hypothetical protein
MSKKKGSTTADQRGIERIQDQHYQNGRKDGAERLAVDITENAKHRGIGPESLDRMIAWLDGVIWLTAKDSRGQLEDIRGALVECFRMLKALEGAPERYVNTLSTLVALTIGKSGWPGVRDAMGYAADGSQG